MEKPDGCVGMIPCRCCVCVCLCGNAARRVSSRSTRKENAGARARREEREREPNTPRRRRPNTTEVGRFRAADLPRALRPKRAAWASECECCGVCLSFVLYLVRRGVTTLCRADYATCGHEKCPAFARGECSRRARSRAMSSLNWCAIIDISQQCLQQFGEHAS